MSKQTFKAVIRRWSEKRRRYRNVVIGRGLSYGAAIAVIEYEAEKARHRRWRLAYNCQLPFEYVIRGDRESQYLWARWTRPDGTIGGKAIVRYAVKSESSKLR